MKAMILAAGLGTRLRPLTNHIPKALVPVGGTPMIEIILRRLKNAGFREVIINLHYLADQIVDFIKKNDRFGMAIEFSDESDQLLDTGGAIKKASWFLDADEPFLLHNVDEITDINLKDMFNFHQQKSALVSLAVKKTGIPQGLLFDEQMMLGGWENTATGQQGILDSKKNKTLSHYGFCGIHIISSGIFSYMDQKEKFPIIPFYLDLASLGKRIIGYHAEKNIWIDIGSHEQLDEANKLDPGMYNG